MTVYAVFASVLCGLAAPFYYYNIILLYQLSAYRLKELFTAVRRKSLVYFLPFLSVLTVLFAVAAVVYAFVRTESFYWFILPFLFLVFCVAFFSYRRAKVKTVFSARLRRFAAVFALTTIAFTLPVVIFYPPYFILAPLPSGTASFFVAHLVVTPFEKKRNARFVRAAKEKLQNSPDLIKIGITGSYGKTTAKNMLKAFLTPDYSVCITPGNYNTPMGIAKTVNNELLSDDTAFIAEMGARYTGDIKELTEIVKPSYAMITAIGNQHLETFGSYDALLNAKNELIEGLPSDGLAVFNGDNEGCVTLYKRCKCRRLISGRDEEAVKLFSENVADERGKKRSAANKSDSAAIKEEGKKPKYVSSFDACYGEVSCTAEGTEFTVILGGKKLRWSTRLIGAHIPSAITQCALMAYALGVKPDSLKNTVAALKPVAHRLELLYNGNDVIIDDAYNGNESGAKSAFTALAQFAPRVRVAITPGLVELGERQAAANKELGEFAAAHCDYAIFTGPNSDDLEAGALSGGMNPDRVFKVRSLNEAKEILKTIKGEKAVLFENDLPDNY